MAGGNGWEGVGICRLGVPPEVEPSSQDVRQALGRPVLLRCSLLRGSPQRIASAVWRFKGQLLLPPPPVVPAAEAPDHAELHLDAVTRDSSGSYECSVSNDVGSAACLFQVSGERPEGPTPPTMPTRCQAPPHPSPGDSFPDSPRPAPLKPAYSRLSPSLSKACPGQGHAPLRVPDPNLDLPAPPSRCRPRPPLTPSLEVEAFPFQGPPVPIPDLSPARFSSVRFLGV
ncbi:hypothetical protein P7K49_007908 [Saguinus oedipus]|uniref:Ig-like domain-containing protein n=1 Tax=Saguinus oedipus TaxID=9490 RepID=A0ABQ9VWB1_SAGOE|nr:hypothetical protein P7K49_007908 [Saguinus oedipus]